MSVEENQLVEVRHKAGVYSIKELCAMFGIGRAKIDHAINTNKLKSRSPNNRIRFIKLKDFLAYMGFDDEDIIGGLKK